jgi:hypothetical protein
MASTAALMLPNAEKMMTGKPGCIALSRVSSSNPSISGIRMSVNTRSTVLAWNTCSPLVPSVAVRTS